MAAYFHGNPPEMSTAAAAAATDGGLQTLILMNPTTYVQFSDHQQQDDNNNNNTNNNFVFLNPHAPPPSTTQQFVGIPLSGHHEAAAAAAAGELHGFLPRVHYNPYNNHHHNNNQSHVDPTACETPRASSQQGLSLTLSSQQQQQQQTQPQNFSFGFGSGEEIRVGPGSTGSGVLNGVVSGLLSSKYLKAAQEILDEVVNVNNSNELLSSTKKASSTGGGDKVAGESSAGAGSSAGGDVTGKRAAELSTAERQEIQMKKAKLISMLHEVEQRYRQYHEQMQIVIASFEQAAGIGSAKSYTSLALKTISRQFRCLKDAIAGQIKAANKCLGEEESVSGGGGGGGMQGLKFVDHQLRQQRALQQLGMIHHPNHHNSNAWRPQRGLPERAVSVLRAWLFEHFLHPYPKDSDKHMLAKQTGLTRSQVSNWFINARVRLWKPMVEEMYLEEMKEQEKNNGSMDKTVDENKEDCASKQGKSPVGTENYTLNNSLPSRDVDLEGVIGAQGSPKRLRTDEETLMQPMNVDFVSSNEKLTMKVLEERQQGVRDGYAFMGSFGQYQMDEMPRFDVSDHTHQHLMGSRRTFSGNNGVSLTLGLPHCDQGLSSATTHHQSFMPTTSHNIQLGGRVKLNDDFASMNASESNPHSSSSAYNGINIENQKRFVAQLLPDLVS